MYMQFNEKKVYSTDYPIAMHVTVALAFRLLRCLNRKKMYNLETCCYYIIKVLLKIIWNIHNEPEEFCIPLDM